MQYCNTPSCRGPFRELVEMDHVFDRPLYDLYRCPLCMKERLVKHGMFNQTVVEEEYSPPEYSSQRSGISPVGKVAISAFLLMVIGGLASGSGKK